MKRKAQITMFIIIGVVLLIGVGMMIYLVSSKAGENSEEGAMQSLRPAVVQPIKDYVTSCLDVAASQALELVGKQGGVIYESQGGVVQDPLPVFKGKAYLDYGGLKLIYDIIPPSGNVGSIFFSEPPDYPWPSFPYVGVGNQEYGYFGISKLPPLYREVSGPLSIQDQLEKSIASNVIKCVDWSNFEAQGTGIEAGTPSVQMIIAENTTQLEAEEYISFVLNWSVELKEHATQAKTTLEQFAVSYPIRFGQIYYTVKDVIDSDITNISYEPQSTKDYFITINKDVFGRDDVMIYQDAKAKLKGKPYEFRIARKNRAPALQLIDQARIDKYRYCIGNELRFSGNQLTFVPLKAVSAAAQEPLSASQIFPLRFNASDPDNDDVTYAISPAANSIDVDYWATWAVASYNADQATGGLKITVAANDSEFKDYQVIRFIPIACQEQ